MPAQSLVAREKPTTFYNLQHDLQSDDRTTGKAYGIFVREPQRQTVSAQIWTARTREHEGIKKHPGYFVQLGCEEMPWGALTSFCPGRAIWHVIFWGDPAPGIEALAAELQLSNLSSQNPPAGASARG